MPEAFGGKEISNGVFWGGSYEALQDVIINEAYNSNDIKLFIGYAGWSPGQLELEMNEGSWLVADISTKIIFETKPEKIWQQAIKLLGDDYTYLANMPLDPQLN